jgi:hypothetical protein
MVGFMLAAVVPPAYELNRFEVLVFAWGLLF